MRCDDGSILLYPAVLTWKIIHDVDLEATIPDRPALQFMLDRLEAEIHPDVSPFVDGIMARLEDRDGNQLSIGCTLRWAEGGNGTWGCLDIATSETIDRCGPRHAPRVVPPSTAALGRGDGPGEVDFFLSHFDCPCTRPIRYCLPYPTIKDVVIEYMETGELSSRVAWEPPGPWPKEWPERF